MDDQTRIQLEGFRPGLYVRIQIDNMPCEMTENHDPEYPIIVGALLTAEQNVGYVQVYIYIYGYISRMTLIQSWHYI